MASKKPVEAGGDSGTDEEQPEAVQPISEGATEAVTAASKVQKEAADMPATVGGFTNPLPTNLATLPDPFRIAELALQRNHGR